MTAANIDVAAPSQPYSAVVAAEEKPRHQLKRPARALILSKGRLARMLRTGALDGETAFNAELPTTCSICISDFHRDDLVRRVGGCKHVFHSMCLEKWLMQYQARCPLCNLDLLQSSDKNTHK